ncbi:MAG: MerR family DNA-binding transcriptional regulator [Acidovorax sp.]
MQISQLASATGLSIHRLRRYADAGLLLSTRGPGGYRVFDAQAVRDARFIAMGRDIGFALAELADLLPRYRARTLTIGEMVRHLHARIATVDAAIAEQQALRARLVEHVAWFEARQRQAGARPPAPAQNAFQPSRTRRTP